MIHEIKKHSSAGCGGGSLTVVMAAAAWAGTNYGLIDEKVTSLASNSHCLQQWHGMSWSAQYVQEEIVLKKRNPTFY